MRRHANTTKYEIVQTAVHFFLEKGYSSTAPRLICDEMDISTGNLTYYFPTKEHLLAILVEMLCRFQRKLLQEMVQEDGATSLFAMCMELATMAAVSEESEIAKDLFLSAYSSPMSLEIIRKNDVQRATQIYGPFCPDWNDLQHIEAEILVSGIEYATLMTTSDSAPLEARIVGALNNIMTIYNVPEALRKAKIDKVLATDYRAQGRLVLEKFKQFVHRADAQILEDLLK